MLELTIKLVLFLFPLAYSPGPGNMFFAANGARFGFAATFSANAGYHLATWVVTLAIGLGFGLVALQFPTFLLAIKYLGSAYVLYLAWLLVKAGTLEGQADPRHAGFVDGMVLLILNPKAYLIIALIFTQFTSSTGVASFWLIVWISTVFTINNLVAFSLWAAVGDGLATAFRNDAHARKLNLFFGVTLAAVAVWMLLR
ncbi:MAG: LysE family translocator [Alphaproteobacteria bacterium]|nr:LysE family translocator [Alphaproteobacteria bacterium]